MVTKHKKRVLGFFDSLTINPTNQKAEIINTTVCIAGLGLLPPHLLQVFGRWLHLISDDKRADKQ